MSEEDKNNGTINAVTELVKAVPVYTDMIQPAAREVGKSLETLAKTINGLFLPLRAVVWGFDRFENFLNQTLAKKLEGIPEEKVQAPDLMIAGPSFDALRYAGHKEELQEMFANLLANSMHIDLAKNAHPAFVDIIKSLSPDEAKIIRYFANILLDDEGKFIARSFSNDRIPFLAGEAKCLEPHAVKSCLWNIQRLGIVYNLPTAEDAGPFYFLMKSGSSSQGDPAIEPLSGRPSGLRFTEFGIRFVKACLVAPNEKGEPSPEANAQ